MPNSFNTILLDQLLGKLSATVSHIILLRFERIGIHVLKTFGSKCLKTSIAFPIFVDHVLNIS